MGRGMMYVRRLSNKTDVTAVPETQCAKTEDGVHIAYQVSGAGPIDLVWVPGGQTRILRAGDSLDLPRRTMHVVRNAGDHEARFPLEVRPAPRMELAMRTLFAITGWFGSLARGRSQTR